MYEVKEKDWKLFRKKIVVWQNNYMDKLNKEYIKILQRDKSPATNFWDLEKRMFKDKKSVGVVVDMRRSRMIENIISLIHDNAITIDDLEEFSDELKECVDIILQR
ncbi:multidrug transporter [Thomasclavelia sp.]|uniref:multidrug transporter n=1 Tax=Thomasclavelia sp. TaxID=3025757 RepID=UPI0025D9B15E|nr:multidrug transporter [Thomasclavelia sp.]